MKAILNNYVEEIKKDVKKLREFKSLAVKHQQFELAANIREIEQDLFPISKKDEILQTEALNFKLALALADLHVDEKIAFITFNTAKLIIEKGVGISLKDMSEIKEAANKLFD
jgi:hypothetical protein